MADNTHDLTIVDEHGEVIDSELVNLDELAQPAKALPYITPAFALATHDYVVMSESSVKSYLVSSHRRAEDAIDLAESLNEKNHDCSYRAYRIDHSTACEGVMRNNQSLAAEVERLNAEVDHLRDRIAEVQDEAQEDMADYVERIRDEHASLYKEIDMWRVMLGKAFNYVREGVEQSDEGGFNGELLAYSKVQSFIQGALASHDYDESMFD